MPILVAYNEIALKSKYVRATLERRLAAQIEYVLKREGYGEARARRQFGRIIVSGAPAEAAKVVANVFGVVHAIPAEESSSEINDVTALAVESSWRHTESGLDLRSQTQGCGRSTIRKP